jgi:hypothetical protein
VSFASARENERERDQIICVAKVCGECGCDGDLRYNGVRGFTLCSLGQTGVQKADRHCRTPGDRTIDSPHHTQSLDLDPERAIFSNEHARTIIKLVVFYLLTLIN